MGIEPMTLHMLQGRLDGRTRLDDIGNKVHALPLRHATISFVETTGTGHSLKKGRIEWIHDGGRSDAWRSRGFLPLNLLQRIQGRQTTSHHVSTTVHQELLLLTKTPQSRQVLRQGSLVFLQFSLSRLKRLLGIALLALDSPLLLHNPIH